ncbi:hypothetical protein [Reichenbachiella sp.]|uniref:hypothetical protein n=1 Tax=Reichenbachiella sp. TaxID=2184521 RepID=UPI003299754F
MPNKEKNLKWFFDKEGPDEKGPNDPIHQKFKGNPYSSIVRESIQNSLDARADNSKPVRVCFSEFEIDRKEYPQFFKIEEHIMSCLDYFPSNPQAKKLVDEMLTYLNGTEPGLKRQKLKCLNISDQNTLGMDYEEGETDSTLYSFLFVSGLSTKTKSGSGGSFGFGKGAFYALSPIKTILVSSLNDKNQHLFIGSTRLTTHKFGGQKVSFNGFYNNEQNRKPVEDSEELPETFKRNEVGTDIMVMGLQDDDNRKSSMIKSVLNNFWLAIHELDLEVEVLGVEINRSNLETIIREYFEGEIESGSLKDYNDWNPMSYYKAVKYSEQTAQFPQFTYKSELLGNLKLCIYRNKGLSNRIAHLRKLKMVVFKRTSQNKLRDYSAVFTCLDDAGNDILVEMENPEHNEWKEENYQLNQKPHPDAINANEEIKKFIGESLDKLSKAKRGERQSFLGLEDYLSIPEDLIGKDEDLVGENMTITHGEISQELSNNETGAQISNNEVEEIKTIVTERPQILDEATGSIDENEGEHDVITGGNNIGIGRDESGSNGKDSLDEAGEGDSKVKRPIKIDFKVAAIGFENRVVHDLIIHSSERISNAYLNLTVGTDNEGSSMDNVPSIRSSSHGEFRDGELSGFSIEKGITKVRIEFADDRKHSIRIKAYEKA